MFLPIGTDEPTPRRRFPFVTILLVTLNSLVFLFEVFILFAEGEEGLDSFITVFGVIPASMVSGRDILIPSYLTLFTSMFVHGGFAHIAFNMLYLMVFGDNVEDRLGRGRYVVFYLLAGLIAAFAQIAVDPASQVPSVGASGAIAGVLSGYIVLFPTGFVRLFVFFGLLSRVARIPALLFVGVWFFTQFLSGIGSLGVATAETGGIAYWAHIGGFAGGLVLAFLFRGAQRRTG